MSSRIDPYEASKDAQTAMLQFQSRVNQTALEPRLIELVKIRASQINRCAFCLEMHTRETRAKGETEARIYLLSAWRESSLYTERERAALAWTESLTNLAQTGVPDADYDLAHGVFSDRELADLTMAIVAINAWNRLGVAFRRQHADDR